MFIYMDKIFVHVKNDFRHNYQTSIYVIFDYYRLITT